MSQMCSKKEKKKAVSHKEKTDKEDRFNDRQTNIYWWGSSLVDMLVNATIRNAYTNPRIEEKPKFVTAIDT